MSNGISIIEKVIDKAPELFFEIDELVESPKSNGKDPKITLELIKKWLIGIPIESV